MSFQETSAAPQQIDLALVLRSILRGWWIIALCLFLGLAIGGAVLAVVPPSYHIEALVAPSMSSQQNDQGGTQSLLAAGMSSLIGSLVGGGSGGHFFLQSEVFAILTSHEIAERIMQHPGVMQQVFKSSWDAENQRWVEPHGLLQDFKSAVKRELGRPAWHPPDEEQLRDMLQDDISITPSEYPPIYKVTLTTHDPKLGFMLLRLALDEADAYLRDRAHHEADVEIAALQPRLDAATRNDTRAVLTQLLMQVEDRSITTVPEMPYAIDAVDPPVLPYEPASPSVSMVMALSLAVGLFIGLGLAVAVYSRRTRRAPLADPVDTEEAAEAPVDAIGWTTQR